jgi:hypothetical protein
MVRCAQVGTDLEHMRFRTSVEYSEAHIQLGASPGTNSYTDRKFRKSYEQVVAKYRF